MPAPQFRNCKRPGGQTHPLPVASATGNGDSCELRPEGPTQMANTEPLKRNSCVGLSGFLVKTHRVVETWDCIKPSACCV